MSIYEYDQEKHMRQEREAEFQAGLKEGLLQGIEEGRAEGIEEGRAEAIHTIINICRELQLSDDDIKNQLMDKCGLTPKDAETYMKKV